MLKKLSLASILLVFLQACGQSDSNDDTEQPIKVGENTPPVAGLEVEVIGDEDNTLYGQLLGEDVDGDQLSYSIAEAPSHGTVSVNSEDGSFEYIPNPNYFGVDYFLYSVSDQSSSSISKVSITINSVNDAPVIAEQLFEFKKYNILIDNIKATDVDNSAEELSYEIAELPQYGSLTLTNTGQFSYQPTAFIERLDSFAVSVSDGEAEPQTAIINLQFTKPQVGLLTNDLEVDVLGESFQLNYIGI